MVSPSGRTGLRELVALLKAESDSAARISEYTLHELQVARFLPYFPRAERLMARKRAQRPHLLFESVFYSFVGSEARTK